MDIALLKTFLEIARLRHFGRAADRLCVTQSAVSARIKLLEEALDVVLFDRKRNDIRLTAAGERLHRHAASIVASWERARQELPLEPELTAALAIGCSVDLWGICVRDAVARLRRERPDLGLALELLSGQLVGERVAAGSLDLALLFEPPTLPELEVRQITEVSLLLVSTDPAATLEAALGPDRIQIDWGPAVAQALARLAGRPPAPQIRATHAAVALDLLATLDGSALLPAPLASAALAAGRLHRVAGVQPFSRPVFALYRHDHPEPELLEEAVGRLRG